MPHIHWVARQNKLEIPNDEEDIYSCLLFIIKRIGICRKKKTGAACTPLSSWILTAFARGSTVTAPLLLHTPLSFVALNRFRSRYNSDSTAGSHATFFGSTVTAPSVLHTPLSPVINGVGKKWW
jgi:hypothetical protein